jgi:hypothetical protein
MSLSLGVQLQCSTLFIHCEMRSCICMLILCGDTAAATLQQLAVSFVLALTLTSHCKRFNCAYHYNRGARDGYV